MCPKVEGLEDKWTGGLKFEDSASCSSHCSCFSPAWQLGANFGDGLLAGDLCSVSYLRVASEICARLGHKTVQGYENKCG